MLSDLAIWYLRKRNKSVMMGHELKRSKIKALNKDVYIYDNVVDDDVDYRTHDNWVMPIITNSKYKATFTKEDKT